jgi:predicted dinucleotide-binding enzyme
MTTVGLIGAGHVGSAVAQLATTAGYDVVVSNSRGPNTLGKLIDQLGPHARAATPERAAADADMAVVTIPMKALDAVPVAPLRGKVVMDTNNYYPQRDGHIPDLDDDSTTSSELLQQRLPDSSVVKVFNNLFATSLNPLARPAGAPDRSALLIAGDDPQAKQVVTKFLDTVGFDAVDAGPLAAGRNFQPNTALYRTLYGTAETPTPMSSDAVRARL